MAQEPLSHGEHCCGTMNDQLAWHCDQHDDPFDCSDALVHYSEKFDGYGIIVHNGGTAVAPIAYCPWCGARLPESARERWFDEVWAMGLEPESEELPAEYRDGRWRQAAP